jgi:small-conductance mechanosensitive channel
LSWEFIAIATGRIFEAWALRLALCVAIAGSMWWAAAWSRSTFQHATLRTAADPNVRLLTGRLVYGGVLILGLIWILGILGVEQASLIATFGVFGLALSLAMQDILKSFFAGLYLLFERPFLIGDEIQIKEHIGRVENVGFRATSIRTSDNVLVIVPNALVFAEVVSNRSGRAVPEDPID